MQLDGAAHGHDLTGDLGSVVLHAGMGEPAQRGDALQNVHVLVLEAVEVHGRVSYEGGRAGRVPARWAA